MTDDRARALMFADAAHAAVGQRRKYTGERYIIHPRMVADIVSSVAHDQNMIAAAYLHDVVEDTRVGIDLIEEWFGEDVAALVAELTDVSKPADGKRAARKALDRAHSAAASARAQTIKVADLIDNGRSITAHDPSFARTYMAEMSKLLEVLTKADPKLLEMARAIVREHEEKQLEGWFKTKLIDARN